MYLDYMRPSGRLSSELILTPAYSRVFWCGATTQNIYTLRENNNKNKYNVWIIKWHMCNR